MATVTYDGQSFMIDGRRIWLVAGQIDYGRIPPEAWADRIHAAKLAGFNTIATSIPWALHEPRTGHFDFVGPRDLRRFVQLIHKAGMLCILRPGPYIGSGWDMGGIPEWVTRKADIRLRAASAPFLEAASRYITAVAEQVRDLQVTSAGEGGPIVLIQNEAAWTCGDDDAAHAYLGELARYYREAGFAVPSINANNLWQSIEGEIEGWVGSEDMLATLRQLTSVAPNQPRVVIEMPVTPPAFVGSPSEPGVSAHTMQRRIVEVLAGGGQFVLSPIAGGQTPGFWPGRDGTDASRFYENAHGRHAPIEDSGAPTESYHVFRRVTTMASSFARVFANLNHNYKPILLDQRIPQHASDGVAVVDLVGTQGSVAFLMTREPFATGKSSRTQNVDILLGDGSALSVPMGRQAAAWVLFNVLLDGRGTMDYCTLCAMALVGKCLVCFGPAGADGVVSINGSPLTVSVPKGKTTAIEHHEGFTLVVANEESIDTVFPTDQGVYIGVHHVGATGDPVPLAGAKSCIHIDLKGEHHKIVVKEPRSPKLSPSLALNDWKAAPAAEHASGSSARYAPITGPADLASLGSPFGYGWYRIRIKAGDGKKHRILAPSSRDRLRFFLDGEDLGIMGFGPGASSEPMLVTLTKSEHVIVVLAENMGRPDGGLTLNEPKGLVDELFIVKPFKAGRHTTVSASPIHPLATHAPLWHMRPGDATYPDRAQWSFVHRKKSPLIITIDPMATRAMVILNDKPLRFLDQTGPTRFMLDQEQLNRGNNTLQLAIMADEPDPAGTLAALASATGFAEGVETITGKAEWAFAKWEPPARADFEPVAKAKLTGYRGPAWYQTEFEIDPDGVPVRLDLTGLSKGQVYFNDQHLGRYFLETATRKQIGPSTTVLLPETLIRVGRKNTVTIFDEHGNAPAKVRLLLDKNSLPIRR